MRRFSSFVLAAGLIAAAAMPLAAGSADKSAAALARKDGKQSYIVVMEQAPLVTYDGSTRGYVATKPGKGGKINPNSAHVRKYQKFLKESQNKALTSAGASTAAKLNAYTFALNGFSALLTPEQARKMKQQKGVVKVMPDVMRYPQTDSSPAFLGLTAPAGPWQTGTTGEGVVVGVIDSGVWPEHPSFADNGSYSSLPAYVGLPCEFGNTAHNPDDAPFTCNNKLLGARQMLATYRALIGADPDEFDSARDDDGHGTHTASTAAGNGGVEASIGGVPRGAISGVAPRARVIAYKGLGNLGGFTSDLAAAIDQAVADGVDVINYSIGGGRTAALGADEIAFLFAADAGVFVATSNGNSGPAPATNGIAGTRAVADQRGREHAEPLLRRFGHLQRRDGNSSGASITGGTGELPLVDAADAGSELCAPGALNPTVVAGKIVLCKRGTYARVAKSYAVYLAGGAGMILYNTFDADSLNTDTHWVPSVHVNFTDGSAIKSYIATEGASAVAQINGGSAVLVDAPWMAAFSSRGPNVFGDIIKPDITAPGVQILAGASPFPDPGNVPGELFQAIAGTSMSSPHIAGIFALIKQAHPNWTPAMAKSAIMTTAYQDVMKEDGATPADPFDMGAGHVKPGSPNHKGSAFQPGLAYDAGLFEYAAFTCGANLGVFTTGTCAFLESIGVPSDPSDLNLPSIGIDGLAGSQTVKRTVTSVAQENGWREYTPWVETPPGYNVTVSPSTIRLKSGQSATYEVTITNDSAPVGEWRHGALTWKDKTGNYSVRSPISVSAALFAAPEAVTGSGESGSASFDIGFGYTGSYSAAAHGLEPAAVTSDNVVQDPDQTFNPGDGFSNLHQFNLSGAALLRFALPPEATESRRGPRSLPLRPERQSRRIEHQRRHRRRDRGTSCRWMARGASMSTGGRRRGATPTTTCTRGPSPQRPVAT